MKNIIILSILFIAGLVCVPSVTEGQAHEIKIAPSQDKDSMYIMLTEHIPGKYRQGRGKWFNYLDWIDGLMDTITNRGVGASDTDWLKGSSISAVPTNSDTATRVGVTHQKNNPLLFTRTTGGYWAIVKSIQTTPISPNWNFTIQNNDNAGSARDNHVFNMGWNLTEGGGAVIAGLSGIGLSFEDHYEPTAGDSIAEYHTFFIDGAGVQHRLQSYTIPKATPGSWNMYQTLGTFYIKDPTNDLPFLSIVRSGTTGSGMQLLGSASGKGAQFTVDVSNTNFQISPFGYTGIVKNVIMDAWNNVQLPAFRSSYNGTTYSNTVTKGIYPLADNDCVIGNYASRFSELEATSARFSKAADTFSETFKITQAGAIIAANLPTHADEAAAVTAGLVAGTIYKTATGELRIKL